MILSASMKKRLTRSVLGSLLALSGWSSAHAQSNEPKWVDAYGEPVSAQQMMPSSSYGMVCPPGSGGPGTSTYDAYRNTYEALPEDRGFFYDHPLDGAIKNYAKQMWFRMEYVDWHVTSPGGNIVGSPLKFGDPGSPLPVLEIDRTYTGTDDPVLTSTNAADFTNPQPLLDDDGNQVFDASGNQIFFGVDTNGTPIQAVGFEINDTDIFPLMTKTNSGLYTNDTNEAMGLVGEAQLIDLSQMGFEHNNGIRATIGGPTSFGNWEADVFVIEQGHDTLNFSALNANNPLSGEFNSSLQNVDPYAISNPPTNTEYTNQRYTYFVAIPVTVNGQVAPDIAIDNGTFPQGVPFGEGDNQDNLIPDGVLDLANARELLTGRENNFLRLFNESYTSDYRTESFGTQINHFWTLRDRGRGFRFAASLGARYMNIRESFNQRGVFSENFAVGADGNFRYPYDSSAIFTDANTPSTSLVTAIDSSTNNNIFGPQLGFRSEFVHDWFVIGATPKVMLGLNSYDADLNVQNFLFAGDNNRGNDSSVQFAPMFDFGLYARLKVPPQILPHAWFTVGYDLIWAGRVTRPDDNINYNVIETPVAIIDQTTGTPRDDTTDDFTYQNDVRLRTKKQDFRLDGLTLGFEVRY